MSTTADAAADPLVPERDGRPDPQSVYPVLDSLRAVAAIAVVATHVAFLSGYSSTEGWGTLTARLEVGVAIFFVLSGFLLSQPYLKEAAAPSGFPSTRHYLWKRAIRILPVYWVSVVAALLLVEQPEPLTASTWWHNLTLTTLYGQEPFPLGLGQMWSLGVEVTFYLILPLLGWFAVKVVCRRGWHPRALHGVAAAMVLISVAWDLGLAGLAPDSLFLAPQWLPAYLGWFGVGLSLAVVTTGAGVSAPDSRWSQWVRHAGASPWTCWGIALALLAVASTPLAGPSGLVAPTAAETTVRTLLYGAIAGMLVLPGVLAPPATRFARLMSAPALRHLGRTSYSLFCCHLIVLHLLYEWRDFEIGGGQGPMIFAWTLALSLVVAEVLYRVVERPAMRLRNLGRRRGPGTTSEATTPSDATTSS
ncbi:peptidoglycan/LPS O-acetylase OafA/YrhL [Mumia flava]|uniref:Peptidoglycan/LPS O-acetylase OafA/YrhL n=1 Tax=Mumia flava TaxID=1348852 RepID=A0A2M9BDD9_9ACTN|nr:acyltransferase [Mumia flava]PJJ55965.1 peptidoglycan/LPS O-acetylase OafA/YrhL [Mumia flava]